MWLLLFLKKTKIGFLFTLTTTLLLSCNSKKVEQGKETVTSLDTTTKVIKKSFYNCEEIQGWFKENAITINPDNLFKHNLSYAVFSDTNAVFLDTVMFKCLLEIDTLTISAKTIPTEPNIGSYPILTFPTKLYDVYLDKEDNLKGFTVIPSDAAGHLSQYYVSLNPKTHKIKDVVRLAYHWGDMGFVWDYKSKWLNDSTLIKEMKETCFDSTVYDVSLKIHLHQNGRISFSEINEKINLDDTQVALLHKKLSAEFWKRNE